MFTGIVEELGTVQELKKSGLLTTISLQASKVLEHTKIGDSIAVNGVCLTATQIFADGFSAEIMNETVQRSSLNQLKRGSQVNLERALALGDRLGGHLVSGHVDGLGRIRRIRPDALARWFEIEADPTLLKYVVHKGSIAIDGISLTVARVCEQSFWISSITHTQQYTTLHQRKVGDLVNLECDLIGKYIEKFLAPKKEGISLELLQGF